MEPKQQAVLFFCCAATLATCAIMYAVWQNRRMQSSEVTPRPATTRPPVALPPSAPSVPASTLPKQPQPARKPTPVTPVQLVHVYPGGWVWNPEWHDRYYWRNRDPKRWDHWEWKFGREHWDENGKHPWERPPIPPHRDGHRW